MNPGDESSQPAPALPAAEVEQLLASVAKQEAAESAARAVPTPSAPIPGGVQIHDFRNPMLLPPRQMRKLRVHQDEFVRGLASRMSLLLRQEFSLKLNALQTVSYQTLADSWANPTHLTLFKTEPLRGVSILEIPSQLAAAMVDRLMGGPGIGAENPPELSEIEQALLEQAVQTFLDEWCGHWAGIKELKPVILGSETNGRFLPATPAETGMLVLVLEATLGEYTGRIQFGFPFAALEALIRQMSKEIATPPATEALPPAGAKWNPNLDEIRVPLTAEWSGLEMSAREIAGLKIGDVIPLDAAFFQQVNVRLADLPKFHGRPGTIAGQWAVEVTQLMQR